MNEKNSSPVVTSKRCPYCSTELALHSRKCLGCGKRVGKVDATGRATEPIDWKAYAWCVAAWLMFAFFIWWGFFRK